FVSGKQISDAGLVPIMEQEADIHSEDKSQEATHMQDDTLNELNKLSDDQLVMLKLTLPTEASLFNELVDPQNEIDVVTLSGGYSTDVANNKLKENDGISASFSRALTQDLHVSQSDETFNKTLEEAVKSIYDASL